MPGQGALMHKLPEIISPSFGSGKTCPLSSTRIGCTPGNGSEAHDGMAGVTPARLEIMIPPVSVCHQVSMIGHFFLPIFSSYQCHASSLIGSPTVPKIFNDERSLPSNGFKPNPI